MDTIIEQIINNFDFAYMFVINILTYIIIKSVDYCNGKKKVPLIQKRIILIISIFVVTTGYILCDYDNNKILLNSAILAPVFWSWVAAPICNKLGINYRKVDEVFNNDNCANDDKNDNQYYND